MAVLSELYSSRRPRHRHTSGGDGNLEPMNEGRTDPRLEWLDALPGGELVRQGLVDLEAGIESVPSLLVSIGASRLRRAGLPVPESTFSEAEIRLWELLALEDSDSAHGKLNALVRRLVSFEQAIECELSSTK